MGLPFSVQQDGKRDNMAHRIETMAFRDIYDALVTKAVRRGRTQSEVNQLICWLLGYDEETLQAKVAEGVDHRTFYEEAPRIHPLAGNIRGTVCGVKLAEITDPLMLNIRRLDKLVDDLAKGKALEQLIPQEGTPLSPAPSTSASVPSVDDPIGAYIAQQPEGYQARLNWLRDVIRSELPDSTEKISWGMPTWWQGRNIIHFAQHKQHIGLYPGPDVIMAFADALRGYRTSKGVIQLPNDQPIDETFVRTLVRWLPAQAMATLEAKAAKRAKPEVEKSP